MHLVVLLNQWFGYRKMNDMETKESKSFLELPYAERQLIVVVDNRVAEADRKAKANLGEESNKWDWTSVTKTTLQILAEGPIIALAREVINAVNRIRAAGITVHQISESESAALKFPPGHPRDGVLYAGHPDVREIYYRTAQFHRLTFGHKFCEAIDLLMALGAIEINVEHKSGWGREFSSTLNVPIGTAGEQVSAGGRGSTEKQGDLLFQASLPGAEDPAVPDELVWGQVPF